MDKHDMKHGVKINKCIDIAVLLRLYHTFKMDKYDMKHGVKNGQVHRSSGAPAVITYYDDGQIQSREWYIDGMSHRIDDPSVINYFENGKIRSKSWLINHSFCRPGSSPAIIRYFENGQIQNELYITYGKLCIDTPENREIQLDSHIKMRNFITSMFPSM